MLSQEHDEGYDVVPNSDLTVAREAARDNTSKYYLSGKVSNFTEVTKVLKGKGVDLDNNRFLILQVRPRRAQPLPTSHFARSWSRHLHRALSLPSRSVQHAPLSAGHCSPDLVSGLN